MKYERENLRVCNKKTIERYNYLKKSDSVVLHLYKQHGHYAGR